LERHGKKSVEVELRRSTVAIDPRASPVKPGMLRFLFGIELAKDARTFNKLIASCDGSAGSVPLRLQDIFLLQDSVAPDAVPPIAL
jgi:hypothetical protein